MSGDDQVVPERLVPIKWLIGTWESIEAKGEFPTISPFEYNEVVSFSLVGGQPLLSYSGLSQNPASGNPMHRESGFLRVRGERDLSFMVAHNFGLATVEEGQVENDGHKIVLKTDASHISRMTPDPLKKSEAVKVIELERVFSLDVANNQLIQEVKMATDKTPNLTQHLRIVYKRKSA